MTVSVASLKRRRESRNLPDPQSIWQAGWHDVGGKRIYFRSKWEKNYAAYLEWLRSRDEILAWQYEPETFWFAGIRRGVVSYKPDFLIVERSGERVYHEIKGFMDPQSATKLKRMAKYHPTVKVVLISKRQYYAIAAQVRNLVPGWL